jgi:methylglutaconyl-CoA hydratase
MTETLNLDMHDAVARIRLTRPDAHNAFTPQLIAELTDALDRAATHAGTRVIVLAAEGKSFSAGADLNWMRAAGELNETANLADAKRLCRLFRTLYRSPKPVIARVQGAAIGGGLGLVAACDIAVCAPGARFGLTEVRLGLAPAIIGPYVAEAIGLRQTRRYALTGELFDAGRALALGLVHDIAADDRLDTVVDTLAGQVARGGPRALGEIKELLRSLGRGPGDDAVLEDCTRRIARLRGGAEAREGLSAFLEKRTPAWQGDDTCSTKS